MATELSYVIITPYTIKKSRTGGVIARLLSRTDLELVAARIIAPSAELAGQYAEIVKKTVTERGDEKSAVLLHDYIKENFTPGADKKHERLIALLFKGENACAKLSGIVGRIPFKSLSKESITGETIRDTYADLVMDRNDAVKYFEPAVLTAPSQENAIPALKLFADYAAGQPNIVENIAGSDRKKSERTLVIIKPDNWRHPSTRPGNIIDMLSRTGLRIVGCKIYQMSVSEALEFYGPVQGALRKKLAPAIGQKAAESLETEFGLKLPAGAADKLTDVVGVAYADDQFYQIVEFMSGVRPDKTPDTDKNAPGKVKCMVLIYEGPDAVRKIRDVLGPTDPNKAPGGTVRRDFGHNVMVNTAHASDSQESFKRETGVIKIESNQFSSIISDFIKSQK
jgi:nucleoside diphosphate kinase